MILKKSIVISLFSLILLAIGPGVMAAPPDNELSPYLSKIDWTKQDLMKYLAYYEIPLDEINSVADLEDILGTPISTKNYQNLLSKYNLSDKQIKDLIGHYGGSLNNYKFIEDLDASVGFYVQHDDFMAEIENDLNELGISEKEVEKFFDHLSKVEEKNKNQLDRLKVLDARMEGFLNKPDSSDFTKEQIAELTQIFTEASGLLNIKVHFNMNNKDIPLQEVLTMEDLPGNLYTSISSNTGEVLMDFNLTSDYFQSVLNGWDEMLHLGDLSNQMVDLLRQNKYNAMYKKF